MFFQICGKNRRRVKLFMLVFIVMVIGITLVRLNSFQNALNEHLSDERVKTSAKLEQPVVLKPTRKDGVIVPEKYDEHKVKTRIINEKMIYLKEQQKQNDKDSAEEYSTLNSITTSVHIFYSAPVPWYKPKKINVHAIKHILDDDNGTIITNVKSTRTLNTAFYPALGLYKPTNNLLDKHFKNVAKCGIGVLILSYSGRNTEIELYNRILDLVPNYNLSVTFEINVSGNQSMEFLRQELFQIQKLSKSEGFYRVYSMKRRAFIPVLYVDNAYKLSETAGRLLCRSHPDSVRRVFDAYFIGHVKLKNHAESLRRLCFEGFYSKLPSNGATFSSTWKNWSYLKSFALTYKMLFVPTVGPGFAERNKFPRHGDIQRHRSNGKYYGVAWRTAILNHVGFINIASYNNWPEGSQIEEVIPKAGFLDYNPGAKTKYLELTAHWVGNLLKVRREAVENSLNCYEFLNNTIC